MALTGQQFELLHQAFLDAFNPSGFEQMLLAKTGTNLWSIARVNGNFTDITFDVLNHFAQKGRLRELLDGATAFNPLNKALTQVVRDAQAWDLDTPVKMTQTLFATPQQLPPETVHFVGRERLVAQVQSAVQPGRVVTLWGPGGRGKTAVAWRALHTLQESGALLQRFPDGVLFHTFYGRPQTDVALTHFAQSLGIDDVRDPLGACRRALSGKLALLILDGAEDADDLRRVLDVRGGCGVLITTRNQSQAPDLDWLIPVNQLAMDDAVALVRVWAGARAGDTETVEQICAAVDRLALAVRLSGILLGKLGMTAAAFLAWLRQDPLDVLVDDAGRRSRNVNRLLDKSVAEVGDDSAVVLTIAGNLAFVPFGEHVLQGVLGSEPHTWSRGRLVRAVQRLVDYGLLTRPEPGWLAVSHALIYSYAGVQKPGFLENPGFSATAALGAYYIAMAERESARGLAGYAVLDEERAHMLALLPRLAAAEAWEIANRLVWAIAGNSSYLDYRGYWTERMAALRLGIAAARALDIEYDESAHRNHLGLTLATLGRLEEAISHYKAALKLARNINDKKGQGTKLGNLGNAYYSLGRIEEAIDQYQQALAISREIGDRRTEGSQLGNLGNAYYSLGRIEEAIDQYEQALAIAREIGDRRGEGNQLGNLGNAYYSLGRIEEAIDQYQQALAIAREIGDRRGEGARLGNLGNAYYSLGRIEEAIDQYQQALAIAREIGNRRGEANHCWNLGLLYEESDPARAVQLMSVCVAFEQEIGHPDAIADTQRVEEIKRRHNLP
ncbi:MAG: tetratricopeptide repeat protein [Anaerolineae bacterium]|nr:tetratricopeptide repeat protein [Anaerolineae bacterium]